MLVIALFCDEIKRKEMMEQQLKVNPFSHFFRRKRTESENKRVNEVQEEWSHKTVR